MAHTAIVTSPSDPNVPSALALTPVDAVEGMAVDSRDVKLFYVRNRGAAACTVTLKGGSRVNGAFLGHGEYSDNTFVVPAGGASVFAEPEDARYQQSRGQLYVDFDQGDQVSIGAITF